MQTCVNRGFRKLVETSIYAAIQTEEKTQDLSHIMAMVTLQTEELEGPKFRLEDSDGFCLRGLDSIQY